MTKKILIAAIAFVFLYNLLFFKHSLNVAWGIFFLLLNYFYFLLSKDSQNKKLGIIFSSLSITFGFLFGFRDNDIVQAANILLAFFSQP